MASPAPKPVPSFISSPSFALSSWQRYKLSPAPAPGLAAVKHAALENDQAQPPVTCSRPSSCGELYAYYKRMGMLEVFFSLFPGP